MRFEVYFRCYRYLGKLLYLFNFIGIINYLWHMNDIYLVTQTPDRMLKHWGRMQMYITYMGMFWGKTLWLDVCVMFGVGSWASDPQQGCRALLDPGVEWERTCMRSTGQGFPLWIKNIETDPTSYHHLQYTIHLPPILLTIHQHCFRYGLGAQQATCYYLNKWWPSWLMHICVTRPLWVKSILNDVW